MTRFTPFPTPLFAALLYALFVFGCATDSSSPALVEPLTFSQGFARQSFDVRTRDGDVHAEVVLRAASLCAERRLIVMVPGTLANGAGYYDIARGTGYDAAELLARAGFIVVMVDLPGTGRSFRPADGRETGVTVATRAVRTVALRARALFGVYGGIDVYGETGVGTNVALLLAREPWVRSVVLSATFYEQFGPFSAQLFDPAFHAGLDMLPTGYLPQDPAFIGFFLATSNPAVTPEAVAAIVGAAPQELGTGAYYDLRAAGALGPSGATLTLERPVVAAEPAQADALIIQGSPDFIGSEDGTSALVAAYGLTGGGEATELVLPGASHLMRFDSVIADGPASPFWSAALDFLTSH